MVTLSLDELFPRNIHSGGSEAHCGAFDIIVVSRPWTPGEDAVLAWAVSQDAALLVDISPLPDGRDLFHLRRLHERQTVEDAMTEHLSHLEVSLRQRVAIAT